MKNGKHKKSERHYQKPKKTKVVGGEAPICPKRKSLIEKI